MVARGEGQWLTAAALGDRGAQQRPGPLRRGAGRRRAGQRVPWRAGAGDLVAGRADRSGRPDQVRPSGRPAPCGACRRPPAAAGTDWALGIEARSRALLSDGESAERLYREAIRAARPHPHPRGAGPRAPALRRVAAAPEPPRRRPRAAPRAPTRCWTRWVSRGSPNAPGASCWPPGETVRKRTAETAGELTAQEAQIARLAGDGHTNPEIGAQLFISPPHGRVAPAQGLRQARHQLKERAPRDAAQTRTAGPAGLAGPQPATRGSVRRRPSRPAVVIPPKPCPARSAHSASVIASGSAGR